MADTAIELPQALQIARTFNLAFNNAFMFGGEHQATKDSAQNFFTMLLPALDLAGILTISVERGSVYLENHCVDKLVSVARINSRFTKAGIASVSFDKALTLEAAAALFYMVGSLVDFKDVESMQGYLRTGGYDGVRINYVVYQKVTVDETVVNKGLVADVQLLGDLQGGDREFAELSATTDIRSGLAGILSLGAAVVKSGGADVITPGREEYDAFVSSQIRTISKQLDATTEDAAETPLTPAEMLESVYRLKETIIEHARIQQETGKITAADELAVTEINQLSYQVIVRLIKEEYRSDRTISVKRLAQIIRRMLPDIKELRYLLPQLKDGLFAEGMSPADYLLLVKELSKELASDELLQVMVEASDLIGLSLNELVDGIKSAPEEAARLIVLAAEIKNGGVAVEEQQMSELLSDYIEKVSRSLALQSAEASGHAGGGLLKSAVSRIEQELLERLKAQAVSPGTLEAVAANLSRQFVETVSHLKNDWVKSSISGSAQTDEESVLAIFEQVIENGRYGYNVTEEIRSHLLGKGYSATSLDQLLQKAQLRAASLVTSTLDIPEGVQNVAETSFFIDREIKLHARYNTTFSTLLISYERVVDPWTTAVIEETPDIVNQLTNQTLKLLQGVMKRDTDLIGLYALNAAAIPLMILPMTELAGTFYIQKRLRKGFAEQQFLVNGIAVEVTPRLTSLGYSKKQTPDKESYLKALYEHHMQQKTP